jgi:hypothetical protein
MFPRDIVLLIFKNGTSIEQKQAAIDLVDGEVIGGAPPKIPGIEGVYVVRVPDDGTSRPLMRAIDALEALPQILAATVDVRLKASYRKPSDGGGWRVGDWTVRPELARGPNWALNQINAPPRLLANTVDGCGRIRVNVQGRDSITTE